ncbi:FAD-dependent thymidylate synthase [Candidatus Falkowbacteria bacterium]|nr:MAG: FAD-dependent thymidylate synthase [Candidatus Falkowbacteria bacterium]
MEVKLLSHTPDVEAHVARAAKLCYSDSTIEELIKREDVKEAGAFIQKLISMGHDSPLEHVSFSFGVEGISRVTSHQLVRHRIASYSQQSQRYVNLADTFDYIVPKSIQGNRPAYEEYTRLMEVTHEIYKALLDNDIPAEDARYVLPNATETKIMITMNARALLHFFKVRGCNRAQHEIRNMAYLMLLECKDVAPLLFKGAGPGCVSGECGEGKMSCGEAKEVRAKYEALDESEVVGTQLDETA